MAITKSQAVTFFTSRTKGDGFWAQKADGTVVRCGFSVFDPDDVNTPTTGIVTFGISIYPISADFEVTYLNLDSLGSADSVFIDFQLDLADITFSTLFGGGGALATSVKAPVLVATTALLTATASGSGVGKTLTGDTSALTIDGILLTVDKRVLVKDQTTLKDNGIYTLTQQGNGVVPWILTRAIDFDEEGEVVGGVSVAIQTGTALDDTSWVLSNITGTASIDTDDLVFTLYPTKILEDVKSQEITLSLSGQATYDFSVTMNTSSPKILSTRLFLSTVELGFDKNVDLTFYSSVARKGSQAIQRFEGTLSQVETDGAVSINDTSVTVDDVLSVHPNQLLYSIQSAEFMRVSGVDTPGKELSLEDALASGISTGTGLSKVMEVAGFSVYDETNNNMVYMRIKFPEVVTEDFKLVMVYTEF